MSENDYSGMKRGGRWLGEIGGGLAILGITVALLILGGIAYFVYVMATMYPGD